MTGGAVGHAQRRSDTLIACAVLLLLIAGWTENLAGGKLAGLWAFSSALFAGRHAQAPPEAGPLRKGAYSASSLPAAST
jgi:hypothetical protein